MKPVALKKIRNLNRFQRVQEELDFNDVFPRREGRCRCGCRKKVVPPRRFWATKECNDKAWEYYAIIKGYGSVIRRLMYRRDKGRCAHCSLDCGRYDWEADHILEVVRGGGGCGLENYQTLCRECHSIKTQKLMKELSNGQGTS